MVIQIGSGHDGIPTRTVSLLLGALQGEGAMDASGGTVVRVQYTKDAAFIDAPCTIAGVTEHLILLRLDAGEPVPNLGAMVDLDVAGRSYRSTVQHTEADAFTVLRPRELEHLARTPIDLAVVDPI